MNKSLHQERGKLDYLYVLLQANKMSCTFECVDEMQEYHPCAIKRKSTYIHGSIRKHVEPVEMFYNNENSQAGQ